MKKIYKDWFRKWHRDIGYLFVGLILSFSISGIALNHRETFDSRDIIYKTEPIQIDIDKISDNLDEDDIENLSTIIGIDSEYYGYDLEDNELRIFYRNTQVNVNLNTGVGQKDFVKRRIILGAMADLHQATNKWWIWYSDIFGFAMIFIAITGTFIASGKNSFKKRGWFLSFIGLVFPIIFLLFLI